jgi:DNA recombination protein RmuC
VGTSLGQAQAKYDEAYKRLCRGNNNLIRVGENMRKLGLPTTKKHSARILELSQDENDEVTLDNTATSLAAENE